MSQRVSLQLTLWKSNTNYLLVLDPLEIVSLQLVSRRFFRIARDNCLWKRQCFDFSLWERLRRRREFISSAPIQQSLLRDLHRALGNRGPDETQTMTKVGAKYSKTKTNERIRILANWDPSYPDEKVDWYSEFIQRSAPITVNWLQQPRNLEHIEQDLMVRGAGIYNPSCDTETSMVVGPLDDGSICIWDVSGPSNERGRIIARSAPSTLSTSGSALDAPRSVINSGVTECISVDNHRKRAYFAIQCGK